MCTAASGGHSIPDSHAQSDARDSRHVTRRAEAPTRSPEASEHSPQRAAVARRLIKGYQDNLSGLKMGPTCRFDPTCSSYALEAFSRHGFIKGTLLTIGRLARCGPWHPGGWDPVPTHWPRRRRRGESRTVKPIHRRDL